MELVVKQLCWIDTTLPRGLLILYFLYFHCVHKVAINVLNKSIVLTVACNAAVCILILNSYITLVCVITLF